MTLPLTQLLGLLLFALTAVGGVFAAESSVATVYPQLALGEGFEAVLLVTNASSDDWSGLLRVPEFADGSVAWSVNGDDLTGAEGLALSIGPWQSQRFEMRAPAGQSAVTGSLEIRAEEGGTTASLATSFSYLYRNAEGLVDLVSVSAAPQAARVLVPVELRSSEQLNTGIAFRVLSTIGPQPAGEARPEPVFRLSLLSAAGDVLEQVTMANPGPSFITDLFPATLMAEEAFLGSVSVEANDTEFFLVALRQQLLPGGEFQLTGVAPLVLGPGQIVPAVSTARYRVTFQATWSAATHPTSFPPGPHFSGLIGGTHNGEVSFWNPGSSASPGIEAMAETGSKFPLQGEVNGAILNGTAEHILSGGGISPSPGQVSLEFDISAQFPLVTLVSMIAPSPDWFVGVSGLSLISGGDWVEELVVPLPPWDAGTDNGTNYTSPDSDSNPQQPIQQLTGFPFLNNQGMVAPLGTFTFRRIP